MTMTDDNSYARNALRDELRSLFVPEPEEGLKRAFERLWSGRVPAAGETGEHNQEGSEVDRISSGEKAADSDRQKAN
jgi:hypothetical protein